MLPSGDLPRPLCGLDHVRVIDAHTTPGPDLEYVDVLDRIIAYLDTHPNYHFMNISLGPDIEINDDEVTVWTASLDDRLAGGRAGATFAVGNGGEKDAAAGLHQQLNSRKCGLAESFCFNRECVLSRRDLQELIDPIFRRLGRAFDARIRASERHCRTRDYCARGVCNGTSQ